MQHMEQMRLHAHGQEVMREREVTLLKDFLANQIAEMYFTPKMFAGNERGKAMLMVDINQVLMKLPDLIKEWKYVKQILKERSFDFKDKPIKSILEPNEDIVGYFQRMVSFMDLQI